jgi:hypothetical protein
MANATSVTLNVLAENTAKDDVAESVLDTGTAAVTIPLTPAGDTHNILLKLENSAAAADVMTVEILAGDNPPAFQAGLGDLSIALAQNEIDYVVIESARFMQSDGTISIKSTPASTKAQTLKITAIKLPK